MHNKKNIVQCFLLVLVITAVITFGVFLDRKRAESGPRYILKMSFQVSDTSLIAEGLRAWSDAVYKRTNGDFLIEIFASGVFGIDEDTIEQAKLGANVAVLTDGGRMAYYVQEMGIIGMAYIAENYEELTKITETPTFKLWDARLVENGLKILSYNWYDGPRNFYTNKVINSPSDLNGQRIRTPGAAVWSRSVAALGATPVAMSWGDAYNALQTKAIDGVEAQSTAAYPSRLYEVTNIMTKTEHFQLANFVMVGEKWFYSLPLEYQQILVEECKIAAIENAGKVLQRAEEYEEHMIAAGMQINDVDKAPFIAAVERAYSEMGLLEIRDRIWSEIGKDTGAAE